MFTSSLSENLSEMDEVLKDSAPRPPWRQQKKAENANGDTEQEPPTLGSQSPKLRRSYYESRQRKARSIVAKFSILKDFNRAGFAHVLLLGVHLLFFEICCISQLVFNAYKSLDNVVETYPSFSALAYSVALALSGFLVSIFSLDAIFSENSIQHCLSIAISIIQTLALIANGVFVVVPFAQSGVYISLTLSSVFIAIPLLPVVICEVVFLGLVYPVCRSFGYKAFGIAGTDKSQTQLLNLYKLYVGSLTIDLVVTFELLLLFVLFLNHIDPLAYIAIAASIFFLIATPILVRLGVRRESSVMQVIFLIIKVLCAVALLLHSVMGIIPSSTVGTTMFSYRRFIAFDWLKSALCGSSTQQMCWEISNYHVAIVILILVIVLCLIRALDISLGFALMARFGREGKLKELILSEKRAERKFGKVQKETALIEQLLDNVGED